MSLHHVLLALALAQAHQLKVRALQKVADPGDETVGHFAGVLGRGKTVAQITAQEPGPARRAGQFGHVGVEGEAVNGLKFQDDVILLELGDGQWQSHDGVGWAFVPSGYTGEPAA